MNKISEQELRERCKTLHDRYPNPESKYALFYFSLGHVQDLLDEIDTLRAEKKKRFPWD